MKYWLVLAVAIFSLNACRAFPPGHDPNGPGNSENAPGHNKRDNCPGNSCSAPGQVKKQGY